MKIVLFGHEVEAEEMAPMREGDVPLKVWRTSRFPFTGIIQEKADAQHRKIEYIGYLTAFNTNVPFCQVEMPASVGVAEVARTLDFQAQSLIADWEWFVKNRSQPDA